MTFSQLSKYFHAIESESSRLKITELLADLLKEISVPEIGPVLYLLQGRVCPLYEKMDFGLGEKLIIQAAARAMDIDIEDFTREVKRLGDIGETMQFYKSQQKAKLNDVSILEIYSSLKSLTEMTGTGSQEAKIDTMAQLLAGVDALSAQYIVRIPLNTLRLGFSDMTILDGLSWMLSGGKSERPKIEKAYHVLPDIGHIGTILKRDGIEAIAHIKPMVFVPILMMRAQRMSSGEEVMEKVGGGLVESKYDGFRIQAHFKRGNGEPEVKLYSRGLDDVSAMYPDIIEGLQRQVKNNEVIIEGEALGINPKTRTFLTFQETVQRKRKYDIENKIKEIPLILFTFELLYLDGKSFLDKPLRERRKALESVISATDPFKSTIVLSPQKEIHAAGDIEDAFQTAIDRGYEGIMIKKVEGVYKPGARESSWIKYKRSYASKISDTIDAVVLGYDKGKGKRTSFGIGAILIGVYDEKKEKYYTVSKLGTGLSDDEWREIVTILSDKVCSSIPSEYEVDQNMYADVWVKPFLVLEIRADEISRSTIHTAGRTLKPTHTGKAMEVDESGYALRFPRLERFRPDKKAQDATTVGEIREMFNSQKLV